MNAKQRLDKLMVERGLAPSREKAQALIMAGQVVVGDHAAQKAGHQVALDAEIRIKGEQLPYVSRGGLKLERGLDQFGIDPSGRTAIDVGASTGGFTDCLLQRGLQKSMLLMWAMASWPGNCAKTRGWWYWKRPTSVTWCRSCSIPCRTWR